MADAWEGLAPGEEVIASLPVRLLGATRIADHIAAPRPSFGDALGLRFWTRVLRPKGRTRSIAKGGLPISTNDVVLGVTDSGRLLVWRAKGLGARPGRLHDEVDRGLVVQAAASAGPLPNLSLATSDDVVVTLKPLRRRNLRAFVDALNTAIAGRR